jgi:two-component system NtrC family response regulator
MITYDWPGNVRELRNVIERGIILAENDLITTKCLPSDIADSLEQGEPLAALPTLEQQEKRYILRVMEHVDQNRTQAARILGIGRKTLYRKLRSFEDS